MELSILTVILIAVIIGALAAVMLGAQAAAEHTEVNYGIITVFGIIVTAALTGLWYDKTGISLSVYLILITIWFFLTRTGSPRVLTGMILVIPVAVLIYVKKSQLGLNTAVIAAIISYALALFSLLLALISYNQKRGRDNGSASNYQRPAAGDYYGYGRNTRH